ncbi:MAG: cytidylate kinase-like family protein [Lachnospiraceae bacterium]|nr:cytidylate kinase-like family protein [Lachnospiraceae bacterium]
MKNRIITISREFGSGGRTIGGRVAEKLGIPCYDSVLITKAAEQSGFDKIYVEEMGEHTAGGWFSTVNVSRRFGPTSQDMLWFIQQKVISEIAAEESCVIVGRCADYILRGKADCLNVFIHADKEKRAERIVKEYGEQELSPLRLLEDKDKRRATYYRFYTHMEWGKIQNYHIALDSGVLGIDRCVELIAVLY